MMMSYEHHKRKAEAEDGKQTCRRQQTRRVDGRKRFENATCGRKL